MKKVGLVVEYNPFHNGHLHHVNEVKKQSNADVLIAVMSGNFVMRGEFSVFDKWIKTDIALNHGIDLVVELPFAFAVQNADIFAFGAISILDMLGVDEIYYGSESNDVELLKRMVSVFDSPLYNTLLRQYLDMGFSYPKSSQLALDELDLPRLKANDSLGLQYIRTIDKLNSKIVAKSIQRIHSDYHDRTPQHEAIASATAIRSLSDITSYVPMQVSDLHRRFGFNDWEHYYDFLKYKVSASTSEDLRKIFGMSEGMENAILKANFPMFSDMVNHLVSKRYTKSRIQRLLTYVLCDIKAEDMQFLMTKRPEFVRILGMNRKGRKFLSLTKHDVRYITRVTEGIDPLLDLELRTSKIYALHYHADVYKREFSPPLIKYGFGEETFDDTIESEEDTE